MPIGEGITEVPDSEDEPLTSSPGPPSDDTDAERATSLTDSPQHASPEVGRNLEESGNASVDASEAAKVDGDLFDSKTADLPKTAKTPSNVSEPDPQLPEELHDVLVPGAKESSDHLSIQNVEPQLSQHLNDEQEQPAPSIDAHGHDSFTTSSVVTGHNTLYHDTLLGGDATTQYEVHDSPATDLSESHVEEPKVKSPPAKQKMRSSPASNPTNQHTGRATDARQFIDNHLLPMNALLAESPGNPHLQQTGSSCETANDAPLPALFSKVEMSHCVLPQEVVEPIVANAQHSELDSHEALVQDHDARRSKVESYHLAMNTNTDDKDQSNTHVSEPKQCALPPPPISESDIMETDNITIEALPKPAQTMSRANGDEKDAKAEIQSQDLPYQSRLEIRNLEAAPAVQTRKQVTSSPLTVADSKPPLVKSAQEITLSELKAERAALLASLADLPGIQELIAQAKWSTASEEESNEDDVFKAAQKINKRHIKLLHEYNEIKDVGQGLMGMIADQRGVRILEVQEEFGIDADA